MIRLSGAELVEVPAVPYRDPDNYVRYSGRLAEKLAATEPGGAVWANQFDNVANRQAHVESTAPEIWEQTDGRVDGFICAVGSGGTLAGVAAGLRARKPGVKIGLADPDGAALFHYYACGELRGRGVVDHRGHRAGPDHRKPRGARRSTCPTGSRTPRRWRRSSTSCEHEGLCLGASSGINVAGAMRMARDLGPGHTHRDRALRLRHALPVAALQPRLPARQGTAGPEVARSGGATSPMPGPTEHRARGPHGCRPASAGAAGAGAGAGRGPGRGAGRERGRRPAGRGLGHHRRPRRDADQRPGRQHRRARGAARHAGAASGPQRRRPRSGCSRRSTSCRPAARRARPGAGGGRGRGPGDRGAARRPAEADRGGAGAGAGGAGGQPARRRADRRDRQPRPGALLGRADEPRPEPAPAGYLADGRRGGRQPADRHQGGPRRARCRTRWPGARRSGGRR